MNYAQTGVLKTFSIATALCLTGKPDFSEFAAFKGYPTFMTTSPSCFENFGLLL